MVIKIIELKTNGQLTRTSGAIVRKNIVITVKGGMTYNSTNGFRFGANNTTKYAYKTSFNHPSTTYTDEFLLKTSTNNYGAFKFYGVSGNDNLSLLFHTNNIKLYANGQAVHIGVNINDGWWQVSVVRTI